MLVVKLWKGNDISFSKWLSDLVWRFETYVKLIFIDTEPQSVKNPVFMIVFGYWTGEILLIFFICRLNFEMILNFD